MAEIVVHKLYEEKERQYIIDAYENFGKKTARKWKEELKKIQNFKIIYFYNEEKDIIWLVDLWDLRQDPHKLNLRARRIERKDYH